MSTIKVDTIKNSSGQSEISVTTLKADTIQNTSGASVIKVDTIQDTSGKGFYPARAWVSFDGEGTVSIFDDGNVSSITDNAIGNYTTNFGSSFASSNYTTVGTASSGSGAYIATRIFTASDSPATGSRRFETSNHNDAARDVPYVYAVFTL